MIKKLRLRYSVPLSCRVLSVSESRYYGWLNRRSSEREKEDMRLEAEIEAAHKRTPPDMR
jgi:putative transposase